jgi:hypothetical protein
MVIIREPKHGEASNSTNGKGKASLFSFSFCLRAVVKVNFKPALILGGLADEAFEKTALFLSFSYVCPEPVLVK